MHRLQLLILLLFLASAALWAQDPEKEDESSEPVAEDVVEPEAEISDEEIDELLGLDEDYSDIEDDDFDFSEDVRFEQSTDFPVDI